MTQVDFQGCAKSSKATAFELYQRFPRMANPVDLQLLQHMKPLIAAIALAFISVKVRLTVDKASKARGGRVSHA